MGRRPVLLVPPPSRVGGNLSATRRCDTTTPANASDRRSGHCTKTCPTPSRIADATDHGPRAFGIHCPGEVRQLHNLDLVALHFMYRSLHLISELGAIDFGHGISHKPLRIVDAADHGSRAFDIHCPGEVRQLVNLDLVASHFVFLSLHLISKLGAIVLGHGVAD